MTEEIIEALQAELFWAVQLKTLLDEALITVTDPFERDGLTWLYLRTVRRCGRLQEEADRYARVPS